MKICHLLSASTLSLGFALAGLSVQFGPSEPIVTKSTLQIEREANEYDSQRDLAGVRFKTGDLDKEDASLKTADLDKDDESLKLGDLESGVL